MDGERFDDLTDIYDALIDWPKRLNHEAPFYQRLFDEHQVQKVVDVACGTGRHATMFHRWDLQVQAADISPAMIQRARALFGVPDGLSWCVRGFDQVVPDGGTFDAAVCVGNSLALAPDLATVESAIRQMLRAVRSEGLVIVHVLNLWRLQDGPCVWQKCTRAELPQGEVLIHKGIHRCGQQGFVNLLITPLEDPSSLQTESVRFLGLDIDDLDVFARRGNASDVQFFGGYQNQPYSRQESVDLIMVAVR